MSCYMMDRDDIRTLVEASLSPAITGVGNQSSWYFKDATGHGRRVCMRSGDYEEAARVGQMLWDENMASVKHRYPDCAADDLPGPIGETFEYGEHQIRAFQSPRPWTVFDLCGTYAYQACEHPEWEQSEACAFVTSLQMLAGRRCAEIAEEHAKRDSKALTTDA